MSHHRISRATVAGLALAALAAPPAGAQQQDLRSPDARDAASAPRAAPLAPRDLRSPDARDAAAGRGTSSAPEVTVIRIPQPAPPTGGIDWTDAGFGAGAGLGLSLVAFGAAAAVANRRGRTPARRRAVTPA
jgi:hypothetical protein